jgi:hypothetical protein
MTSAAQLVLIRGGRFQLDSHGRHVTVDPTTGYLHPPGHEIRFAHPAGGDTCTSITLPGAALAAGVETARSPTVRVDARLELAHRTLLRADADAAFAGVEAVVDLLWLALRRQPEETPAPGRHDLADRARDALLAYGSAALWNTLTTVKPALPASRWLSASATRPTSAEPCNASWATPPAASAPCSPPTSKPGPAPDQAFPDVN